MWCSWAHSVRSAYGIHEVHWIRGCVDIVGLVRGGGMCDESGHGHYVYCTIIRILGY